MIRYYYYDIEFDNEEDCISYQLFEKHMKMKTSVIFTYSLSLFSKCLHHYLRIHYKNDHLNVVVNYLNEQTSPNYLTSQINIHLELYRETQMEKLKLIWLNSGKCVFGNMNTIHIQYDNSVLHDDYLFYPNQLSSVEPKFILWS